MQRYNYSLKFELLPIKNHIKLSPSHHHNTTTGQRSAIQYLHFYRSILRVERTKKSLARNSWVLRVQVLLCLLSVCYMWWCGECAKNRWLKKLHFIPNVLLLLSIRATFAMQFGYSWLANVVLLQCKEAPFEGLKSHRRCQTL